MRTTPRRAASEAAEVTAAEVAAAEVAAAGITARVSVRSPVGLPA